LVKNKPKLDSFNEELCRSLVVANISWNKLQVPLFQEFLEKYTGRHIPDESTLRRNYRSNHVTFRRYRKLENWSETISGSRLTKLPILMDVILLIL